MRRLPILCLLAWLPGTVIAEVTASDDSGFVSEHELLLAASPERAYEALTAEVSSWWDAVHSYSGKATNFSLDARPGGCFCEALPNGGVEHLRVVHAAPGKRLNLVGGLGPLQGMGVSGTMSFELVPADDDQTRLRYRYVVHGFYPGGLKPLAGPVDQVQLGQLQRLQAYLAGS